MAQGVLAIGPLGVRRRDAKVLVAMRNSATLAVICDLAAGYPILGPRVGYSCLKAPKAIPGAGQDRSLKLVVWVTAEPWRSGKAVRIPLAAGTFASLRKRHRPAFAATKSWPTLPPPPLGHDWIEHSSDGLR